MPLKGNQGWESKQEVKAAAPRSLATEGRREGQGFRRPWWSICPTGARLQGSTDHRRRPVGEKQVWAEPRPGKVGAGGMGVVPCGAGRACGGVPTWARVPLLNPRGAQLMTRSREAPSLPCSLQGHQAACSLWPWSSLSALGQVTALDAHSPKQRPWVLRADPGYKCCFGNSLLVTVTKSSLLRTQDREDTSPLFSS